MDQEKPRILLTTPFPESTLAELQSAARVDFRLNLTDEQLENIIGDYNALIVDGHTPVSDRVIEYGYKLQVVGVAGASLDHVNVSAALSQDVQVINIPDTRTIALAEMTLSIMLELTHKENQVGLAGKTLGIIGFGALGAEVARRAEAFGMEILVNQPRLTPELALDPAIQSLELKDLLQQSDIVCLLLPSNQETTHLLGKECLALMKPGSCLISAGSADSIQILDLEESLRKGPIVSATIRVHPDDPYFPPEDLTDRLRVFQFLPLPNGRTELVTARQVVEKILQLLQARQAGNPLSLDIVPVENIYPHEHFEPSRVDDLAERLIDAETLVNPPVVAKWNDKFVVLDGATRTNAFKRLNIPHIVVQIVPPKDDRIRLHTWYHALHGSTTADILSHLSNGGTYFIEPITEEDPHTPLRTSKAICSLYCIDGRRFWVFQKPGVDILEALNDLVEDYTEICKIHRTLSTDFVSLCQENESIVALVVFPQFQIQDVLKAAVNETLLPAGITRFVIPGRVLRLNADMEVLKSDQPIQDKNIWLEQFLSDKLARRRVRYYQEPVFLLDE